MRQLDDYCQPGLTRAVCASASNFGQAVAYVGRRAGIAVDVFAAQTANPAKVEPMRRPRAQVHQTGSDFDAAKVAAGTIAVELSTYPTAIDVIYVPVGNGALVNGVGAWLKCHSPQTQVVGVCSEAAPAMAHSWHQGEVVTTESADTIADGIAVRQPVPAALHHLATAVDNMILLSHSQIREAMFAYYDCERLVTEAAGAVSLAAAIAHAPANRGKTVATLVCGSNIDPRLQAALRPLISP